VRFARIAEEDSDGDNERFVVQRGGAVEAPEGEGLPVAIVMNGGSVEGRSGRAWTDGGRQHGEGHGRPGEDEVVFLSKREVLEAGD